MLDARGSGSARSLPGKTRRAGDGGRGAPASSTGGNGATAQADAPSLSTRTSIPGRDVGPATRCTGGAWVVRLSVRRLPPKSKAWLPAEGKPSPPAEGERQAPAPAAAHRARLGLDHGWVAGQAGGGVAHGAEPAVRAVERRAELVGYEAVDRAKALA